MTGKRHDYQVIVTWTGNLGDGTAIRSLRTAVEQSARTRSATSWLSPAENQGRQQCRHFQRMSNEQDQNHESV